MHIDLILMHVFFLTPPPPPSSHTFKFVDHVYWKRNIGYKGHPTLLTVKITCASTYLHVWVHWQHLIITLIKDLKVITLCILCENKVLNSLKHGRKNNTIFFLI